MRIEKNILSIFFILCLVLVFSVSVLCKEKKQVSKTGPTGGKIMDGKYSFDFNGISNELIRQNYVSVNYNIHKNKLYNFHILMNKNWNGVKVAEPVQLPMDGTLTEIGLFNLYSPFHATQGDISAQIVIYISGISAKMSAADYLDKQLPSIYKGKDFKIIQSKTTETNLGPSKDILFSYKNNKILFLSRILAFKVKDDTKIHVSGEKDLLYAIQLTTTEEDYEKFGAEPFYISKISFQLD